MEGRPWPYHGLPGGAGTAQAVDRGPVGGSCAAKRGERPRNRAVWCVCHRTPQYRSSRRWHARQGSRPPRPYGAGKPGQLGHADAVCPAVEALQGGPGRRHAGRGIDGPQQLFALPGSSDLTSGISHGKASPQPHPSSAAKLFSRGQQQLADAVQRVTLAAPMPQGGLLGPSADLVDRRVGQPDGGEMVHHYARMTKWDDQGAGIAAPGIESDHGDLSQPAGRAPSQPSTAALVRSATTSSSRPPSRSTRPVTHRVGARRVALRKLVSSSPSAATRPSGPDLPPAAGRDRPPPASPSPSQPPGHAPPPRPRGRPCRPAGTPQRGPVRSAPPTDGSRRLARSRSAPRRPARCSARSACASTAPPAGRQRAGRVPVPCGGRGLRPARHSLRSRRAPPWSGPPAATRRPRPRRRGPRSRQGPAAWRLRH